jgi:hypothetical protein
MAGTVSTVLLVISSALAVLFSISVVATLRSLRAGHVDAGDDPAGFGIGRGYTFLAALAGMACAAIALLAYEPARLWSVSALVAHASVLVMNRIAGVWNSRLQARDYAERRERERDADR